MTAGASFSLYSVTIGLEPERSRLSIIVALEPELPCLRSWDAESRLPHRFGDPDLGFLCQGLMAIMCDCGDGHRYVGIGVTLNQVIEKRISSRRIFTLILVGCVLPIF